MVKLTWVCNEDLKNCRWKNRKKLVPSIQHEVEQGQSMNPRRERRQDAPQTGILALATKMAPQGEIATTKAKTQKNKTR